MSNIKFIGFNYLTGGASPGFITNNNCNAGDKIISVFDLVAVTNLTSDFGSYIPQNHKIAQTSIPGGGSTNALALLQSAGSTADYSFTTLIPAATQTYFPGNYLDNVVRVFDLTTGADMTSDYSPVVSLNGLFELTVPVSRNLSIAFTQNYGSEPSPKYDISMCTASTSSGLLISAPGVGVGDTVLQVLDLVSLVDITTDFLPYVANAGQIYQVSGIGGADLSLVLVQKA